MAFVIEDEEDISDDFESSPISSYNYSSKTSNNNRSYSVPSTFSWGFEKNSTNTKNNSYNNNASADPYNFDLGDTDNIIFEEGSPQGRKTPVYGSHRSSSSSSSSSRPSSSSSRPSSSSQQQSQRTLSVANSSTTNNNNNNRKTSNDINNRVDEYINKYKYGNTNPSSKYVSETNIDDITDSSIEISDSFHEDQLPSRTTSAGGQAIHKKSTVHQFQSTAQPLRSTKPPNQQFSEEESVEEEEEIEDIEISFPPSSSYNNNANVAIATGTKPSSSGGGTISSNNKLFRSPQEAFSVSTEDEDDMDNTNAMDESSQFHTTTDGESGYAESELRSLPNSVTYHDQSNAFEMSTSRNYNDTTQNTSINSNATGQQRKHNVSMHSYHRSPTSNNNSTMNNSAVTSPNNNNNNLFRVGMRIVCRYGGGNEWYPGTVAHDNGDDTYVINYDDGDSEEAAPKHRVRAISTSYNNSNNGAASPDSSHLYSGIQENNRSSESLSSSAIQEGTASPLPSTKSNFGKIIMFASGSDENNNTGDAVGQNINVSPRTTTTSTINGNYGSSPLSQTTTTTNNRITEKEEFTPRPAYLSTGSNIGIANTFSLASPEEEIIDEIDSNRSQILPMTPETTLPVPKSGHRYPSSSPLSPHQRTTSMNNNNILNNNLSRPSVHSTGLLSADTEYSADGFEPDNSTDGGIPVHIDYQAPISSKPSTASSISSPRGSQRTITTSSKSTGVPGSSPPSQYRSSAYPKHDAGMQTSPLSDRLPTSTNAWDMNNTHTTNSSTVPPSSTYYPPPPPGYYPYPYPPPSSSTATYPSVHPVSGLRPSIPPPTVPYGYPPYPMMASPYNLPVPSMPVIQPLGLGTTALSALLGTLRNTNSSNTIAPPNLPVSATTSSTSIHQPSPTTVYLRTLAESLAKAPPGLASTKDTASTQPPITPATAAVAAGMHPAIVRALAEYQSTLAASDLAFAKQIDLLKGHVQRSKSMLAVASRPIGGGSPGHETPSFKYSSLQDTKAYINEQKQHRTAPLSFDEALRRVKLNM